MLQIICGIFGKNVTDNLQNIRKNCSRIGNVTKMLQDTILVKCTKVNKFICLFYIARSINVRGKAAMMCCRIDCSSREKVCLLIFNTIHIF